MPPSLMRGAGWKAQKPLGFARSVRSLKRQLMLAIGNAVRVEVGAQPVERPAQDPRDLHLADPNVLGDLCLREFVLAAQDDHASFARGEDRGEVVERGLLLDALESGLVHTDALAGTPAGNRGRPTPGHPRTS